MTTQTYPDQEAYQVVFAPGTGGHFICLLLYNFTSNSPYTGDLPNGGHSHLEDRSTWMFNMKLKEEFVGMDMSDWPNLHHYEYLEPIDITKAMIIPEHAMPDWNDLHTVYPKSKTIVITPTIEMMPRIIANKLYKNVILRYLENPEEFDYTAWEEYRQTYWVLLKDIPTPNLITQEILKKLTDTTAKLPYDYSYRSPINYNNVYPLSVYDIYNNKNRTLKTLSQITNKPITNEVISTYDSYIEKQNNMISTNMPWIKM